ncbi:hypothetical protein LTR50_001562 [Elasticomyces elasticus]|nr:hypothetical protein LTR50_001562 [Elasticomyces elasticus]
MTDFLHMYPGDPTETTFSMPEYTIERQPNVHGDLHDPTQPFRWSPPMGSDELYDALRRAFPDAKKHSMRVRNALLQFLEEEQTMEELGLSLSTPIFPEVFSTAEPSDIWPSMNTDHILSDFSASPTVGPLFTPSTPETTSTTPSLSREGSNAVMPVMTTPPPLEQMTGVFSLTPHISPKIRSRRRMTEEEKTDYRRRRQVRACNLCSKRKRKCSHNQAQIDSLSALKHTKSRVTRPRSFVE